jgi:hypothetical protein
MKLSEITDHILPRIKAAWYRQPVDELIATLWHETLETAELADAMAAVRELIRSEREEPPTPGMVYRLSQSYRERRIEERRRSIRALPEPERTPEEIARVRTLVADFMGRAGRPLPVAPDRRAVKEAK